MKHIKKYKTFKCENHLNENINKLTKFLYPYNNLIMTIPQIRYRLRNCDIDEKKYIILYFKDDIKMYDVDNINNEQVQYIIDNIITNNLLYKKLKKIL